MTSRLTHEQRLRWFVPLRRGRVELRPMTEDDVSALHQAGNDPELWKWTIARVRTMDDMRRYVGEALAELAGGSSMPLVTTVDGEVVGSSRFGSIDMQHRRVEIGWTWIATRWQRSVVNTTAKLLMMEHAFEEMSCERVELKTDALNAQSRAAILRIGAREEGILRHHMRTESGRWRDSVYFSVLADEWPSVKRHLEERLAWNTTRSPEE